MHALILGGYGASGAGVARLLAAQDHQVTTAGRDRARADRVVDLRDGPDALAAVLGGVDVVVNAAGIEDPHLVRTATGAGVAFVDITASGGYMAALERLEPPAPVLLSVGLAPGLTNLLALAAHGAGAGASRSSPRASRLRSGSPRRARPTPCPVSYTHLTLPTIYSV